MAGATRGDDPRLPRSTPRILIVAGNIGAGKTTIMNILAAWGYPVVREEVDVWGDLLAAFYGRTPSAGRIRCRGAEGAAVGDEKVAEIHLANATTVWIVTRTLEQWSRSCHPCGLWR